VFRSFVPRTCNSYYLAAVLNYTKDKKKKEEKRQRGAKSRIQKKQRKNEKKKNFKIALHPLSPWFSPVILACLN